MKTITRKQFTEAIEAGIENAPDMPASVAADLRRVAVEHVGPVAHTGFYYEADPSIVCPLGLVGLGGDVRSWESPFQRSHFFRAYDRMVRTIVGHPKDDENAVEVLA